LPVFLKSDRHMDKRQPLPPGTKLFHLDVHASGFAALVATTH
jgi:hypothetical protein